MLEKGAREELGETGRGAERRVGTGAGEIRWRGGLAGWGLGRAPENERERREQNEKWKWRRPGGGTGQGAGAGARAGSGGPGARQKDLGAALGAAPGAERAGARLH